MKRKEARRTEEEELCEARHRSELKCDLRNDSQCALGADQQLLHVVAGVVLPHRRHAVEHLAVGQHLANKWRELLERSGQKLGNSGRTASSPRTLPCSEPYLMNRMPPAPVETFPPIWQLPFAPRSRGTIRDSFAALSWSCSRTQPASATITPVSGLREITLLRRDNERITSSNVGTLPATREVSPPWGTTANFLELQRARILLTSCTVFGRRTIEPFPEK